MAKKPPVSILFSEFQNKKKLCKLGCKTEAKWKINPGNILTRVYKMCMLVWLDYAHTIYTLCISESTMSGTQ